jgi:lon-related putative ATP-dependent protease
VYYARILTEENLMNELTPTQLRRTIDLQSLGIESTETLRPLTSIIGQQRAVSALRFGLGIQELGFNLYISGPAGMGKMTAVQAFLEELAKPKETPSDWCYINNFDDAYFPKALPLPVGWGRRLQQDMKSLIEHLRRNLPKAFESEEYSAKRDEVVKALNREREEIFNRISARATQEGFIVEVTPYGIMFTPRLGERRLTEAEYQALPPRVREEFQQRLESLQDELKSALKQGRELERNTQEKLQRLDQHVMQYVVGGLMEDLRETYAHLPAVLDYFTAVQKDILEHTDLFKGGAPPTQQTGDIGALMAPWVQELPFRRYQVNVLVERKEQTGVPVVVELNPTYNNLFGRVEKETQLGALYTDFTMIKAGALHRANGGYLVLPIEDVLGNLFSWDSLKRALRSREIRIEEVSERLGYFASKTLQPAPIPLTVKVILVGQPLIYYLLHAYDKDFPELFRVKADFDTRMAYNAENVKDFVAFTSTLCQKENLKHLDNSAVARLLEHALRLAEDQEKISTHFGAMAEVIRAANYWASAEQAPYIAATHVRKALDEKIYRSNLIQERIQELIARGTLLVDVRGAVVGQVNGLSVLQLGDYAFGKPSRITATVGPGRGSIMDIEREVELGGPIHSKGVMILNGYLTQKYALEQPLSCAARLVFEQSYEGVEGDSASSAELYALLSALADAPIKQGIAVTGSVNQHGIVQAIGGVNEKIEGFYEVCKAKGLTGEQGVLIPHSNASQLMLCEDVVEAVRAGQFHIWMVNTIDEGIALLTGMAVGERDAEGKYPEDTINGRIMQRLAKFAEALRSMADNKGEKAMSEKQ